MPDSETDLIQKYLAPLAAPAGLGLSDDAACLMPSPGMELVLTADAIVEGTHFLSGDPPADIAAKAIAVNLSDLTAKGVSIVYISHHLEEALQITDHAVVLPRVVVNRSARLRRCVIDSGVEIPAGLVVGEDHAEDAKFFRVSERGVTLITQDMVDRWSAAR